LGNGKRSALGDVCGHGITARFPAGGGRGLISAGVLGGLAGGLAGGLGGGLLGNIKDVQNTAGGGLSGGGLGGVVGDVVPIDDVVVPVSLAGLESSALESECTLPCT